MNEISSKKRNTNIYYEKVCHPKQIFYYFSKNIQKLNLPPKNFNEKCSNRGIWQGSVPGF